MIQMQVFVKATGRDDRWVKELNAKRVNFNMKIFLFFLVRIPICFGEQQTSYPDMNLNHINQKSALKQAELHYYAQCSAEDIMTMEQACREKPFSALMLKAFFFQTKTLLIRRAFHSTQQLLFCTTPWYPQMSLA